MKNRGFEIVKGYENKNINLPKRSTKYSAGYDIEAAEDVVINPFKPGDNPVLVPTGLKVYMQDDEYLMLVSRSSGPKKGYILPNAMGIIDKDYYGNSDNDGHFYFQFINIKDEPITIKKGDKIGQAIFHKYLITDTDDADGIRTSGFGSTDKK